MGVIEEAEEEFENEEMRGFKDYTEQPVLSPTTKEAAPAPIRAGKRGKRRAKEQESCNIELLSLLKKMREEMKQRDEQLKEEVRWRDTHFEEEMKKKEDNLTLVLDESKTHIFLSPFFKYISSLKVQFNVKLWSFYPDLCFAEIQEKNKKST